MEPSGNEPSPSPSPGPLPTAPPPTAGIAPGQGKLSESDDRTMGMLAHLLGGLTNFLGPLIIWLIKKDESPFVNDQGKEALNFQITVVAGYICAAILGLIPFVNCIAGVLVPVIWIAALVFAVLGCLAANKGEVYRYPIALRLIK